MLKHIKNPMVLATIAVALLALLAGIIINYNFSGKTYADASAGALYGATASALTGILAYMLGTVDTRDVPLAFIEAARSDVLDIGYYKRDFLFEVSLKNDQIWVLTIEFSSLIIPITSTAKMKMPLVTPPDKLNGLIDSTKIVYTIDSVQYDLSGHQDYIELKNEKKEKCVIEYKLNSGINDVIEDDHRSWCPIISEIIRAKLPSQYDFSVIGLRGEADMRLSKTGEGNDGISEFRRAEAHFSHQGFKWRLTPQQV